MLNVCENLLNKAIVYKHLKLYICEVLGILGIVGRIQTRTQTLSNKLSPIKYSQEITEIKGLLGHSP